MNNFVTYCIGCGVVGSIIACFKFYKSTKVNVERGRDTMLCSGVHMPMEYLLFAPMSAFGGFMFGIWNAPFVPITCLPYLFNGLKCMLTSK